VTSRLGIAALFLGACSGAHLPPVPPPPASTPSSSSSAARPWSCVTPVGQLALDVPAAHGLPLVGISATVLVGGARITVACERAAPPAPPTAAPDAAVSAAPSVPESQP
jgi:hypothetical protein